LHAHFDVKIAFAMSVEHGNALVANAESRARLGSIGNVEGVLAFERRDLDLGAHGGLRHRKWNDAVQVVAFAHKERMLFYVQNDVQIAGRSAVRPSFAASRKADARAIFHARRNLRLHGTLPEDSAFTFALMARIGDDVAGSLAGGAGAGDAEKTLLVTHLATPVTRAASGGTFAGSGAGAMTFFAGLMAAHHYTGFGAECGFFKLNRYIFAEIGAALHTAAAAATGPESVAEAEELAKDVAQILKSGSIEAHA